ncbi:MAG: hypothetical protein LLG13_01485 [Bacteroidales bacterium]|nr:hypothetical protein [Bacteroidales bacterium]
MRSLLSVCSLVLFFASCNTFICKNTLTKSVSNQDAIESIFDTVNVRKFKAKITYKNNEITGIIIYKKLNDSTFAGSFINEFGIKGFDFKLSQNSTKLENVIKNVDKWYIRNKLETDLHFLFSQPEILSSCSLNNIPVYVKTVNRSLQYVYYIDSRKRVERADMYKHARMIASLRQYTDESSGMVIRMGYINGRLNYDLSEIKR